MKFAYADPPYLGLCKVYDHFHGEDGRCWDDLATHRNLIDRLGDEYPDGWALSLTSTNLRQILPLCPADTRIAAWCKSFGAFKKGVRPAYMWEPVLFRSSANPPHREHIAPPKNSGAGQFTPKDFLVEPIAMQKGLRGAKPWRFCRWVLDLLNVTPEDTVHDLYPGTGAMTDAVAAFQGDYSTKKHPSLFDDGGAVSAHRGH